ncbi:two-component regulator propeller domain-containing protein [Balneolaceae bacterium ANBcel3]|nr:two-component regulator propeller domain-containing protein [Balneolaceae bacterium ANBcel3]
MRYAGQHIFVTILCCVFVLTPVRLAGQIFHDYLNFYHLGTEDGLSQGTANTMLQDYQGYFWIGTGDGLNKFDGNNFTVFRAIENDTSSLRYNEIEVLFEDSNQNLWIGTGGGGFSVFNRETQTFRSFFSTDLDEETEAGLSENTVVSIVEDAGGYLWIGTEFGLNRFNPETESFENFYHDSNDPHTISDNRITRLIMDQNHTLWIATRNGLNYLKHGEDRFYRILSDRNNPTSLSNNHIWDMILCQKGALWIGTNGGGLNQLDTSTLEVTRFPVSDRPGALQDASVFTLFEDSRGVLWVGGENRGLFAFDRENEYFYAYQHDVSNPRSLSFNSIYSIYETRNQILWIGTYSGPVNYLDLKIPRFVHFRHDPHNPAPLSHNNVLSFIECPGGQFWVGTNGGGLNTFERERRQFHSMHHEPGNPNSLLSDVILSLAKTPDGQLLIGQYNGGLSIYTPNTGDFEHFEHDPSDPGSLSHDNVFTMLVEDSIAWLGTHGGGLNRLNLETFDNTIYSRARDAHIPGHLENDYINAIYRDSYGTLWIGTYGNGLVKYHEETETFSHFARYNNYLSGIAALTILEDHLGNLWVGTENGLNLFDRETMSVRVFNQSDGLPNTMIRGLQKDDDGNLWISHNEGISKFYPETETFENYGVESGLQGREFNSRSHYRDSRGYMYFGGPNGFNLFHPSYVEPQTYVAPVVFTELLIFNEPVSIGDDSPLNKHISQTERIELPHHQSVLTFEFVTLNYEIRKNDRFAYMLEGFDQTWNVVGDRRSATYTNLNPGEYRLRVRAANSDGIWGTQEASLLLVITPPFWRTTWFYLFSGVSIAAFLLGVYKQRVRSISKQNLILEQEVRKRTEELEHSNSILRETLNELQNTRDQLVEKAHKAGMADLATNVLHDVGNILNSVNVSTSIICQTINNSHLKNLRKANELLKNNLDSLENFILKNPKGKTLMEYYVKLDQPLTREYEQLKTQNERLSDKIDLIIDVIAAQQNFSVAGKIKESYALHNVIDDTLKITANSVIPNSIKVKKIFKETEPVLIEKTKIIHVIVNLLKNAAESIDLQQPAHREITLRTWQDERSVYLSVSDTGTGFNKETGKKLFKHGFTNKPHGHGFGLHGCANYMKEMNGSIRAESEGPGKGATFSLSLPIDKSRKTGK